MAPAATTRTIAVSSADDDASGGTSCTLRDAIGAANMGATGSFNGCTISESGSGAPTDYVLNLPALAYTYTLTGTADEDGNATGDLDILVNVTINGESAATTILDGDQIDRVLHITDTVTVFINDVTIRHGGTPTGTNGTGSEDGGDGGNGGGIYNAGFLSIASSTLGENATGTGGQGGPSHGDGGDGGDGGGIFNSGTLMLTDSVVISNTTGAGGRGDFGGDGGNGAGICNEGALTVMGSTVSDNTAGNGRDADDEVGGKGGHGGGIYNTGYLLSLIHI